MYSPNSYISSCITDYYRLFRRTSCKPFPLSWHSCHQVDQYIPSIAPVIASLPYTVAVCPICNVLRTVSSQCLYMLNTSDVIASVSTSFLVTAGIPYVCLSFYGRYTLHTLLLLLVYPKHCHVMWYTKHTVLSIPVYPVYTLLSPSSFPIHCHVTWYTQQTVLSMPVCIPSILSCHLRYTLHTVSLTWQFRSLAFPVSDPDSSVLHGLTHPTAHFAISLHATSPCKKVLANGCCFENNLEEERCMSKS